MAPASNVKRELLEAGAEGLATPSSEPFYLPSSLDRDLYLRWLGRRRARELEEMFERDDIRAIVCARGGYGSNYLPPTLDPTKIASNPKIFVVIATSRLCSAAWPMQPTS